MSEQRTEWVSAMVRAIGTMPSIPKTKSAKIPTKSGGEYSYTYADLPSIIELVTPVLTGEGLLVVQSVVTNDDQVGVETRIYHNLGHVEVFGPLYLDAGADARSTGSAITYARRYALCAALGIAADEDDDGKAAVERPLKSEPKQDPATWLATAVDAFGLWTPDQRRAAYKTAMLGLELDKLKTKAQAEKMFEAMAALYYEEFPDVSPF